MIAGLLPLLDRDLRERAARKRTVVIRVLAAIGLYGILIVWLLEQESRYGMSSKFGGTEYLRILGSGGRLFEGMAVACLLAVMILMPALLAGAFTREKESGNLQLLIITGIKPWSLVFGKFAGALVGVLSLLALLLPAMGVAYSLGGLQLEAIAVAAWAIFLGTALTGSVTLACSARCHSTVGSFIASYIVLLVIIFTPPFLDEFRVLDLNTAQQFIFFPVYELNKLDDNLARAIWYGIPELLVAGIALVFARVSLASALTRTPQHYWRRLFVVLDAFFDRLNTLVGNIRFGRSDGEDLPTWHPVRWRERHRQLAGKWRSVVRIQLLLGVISAVVVFSASESDREDAVLVLSLILWGLMALWAISRGALAIGAERSRDCLDVLLTTPLSAQQIVRDKVSAVLRSTWLFLVPIAVLMTIPLASLGIERTGWERRGYDPVAQVLVIALIVIVFPRLFVWLGMFCGLMIRSGIRAVITGIVVMTAWVLLPVLVIIVVQELGIGGWRYRNMEWLLHGSPIVPLVIGPSGRWPHGMSGMGAVMIQGLVFGGAWLALRTWCMAGAERLLGRGR
ncbi:MAG: ABC transporter permease [Planctomycetota bacterium]|jgi:ABC-type transport system involved in multi-copper enzyme maturation permease subunit|nr:ABC transporter permease [Planctomycetota bacterium]